MEEFGIELDFKKGKTRLKRCRLKLDLYESIFSDRLSENAGT